MNRTKRKALQLKVDTLLEDVRKRIVPVGGDMRSFKLNQKFGLVIAPFRAFLHNRVSSVKRRNLEFRECVSQPKAHDLFCRLLGGIGELKQFVIGRLRRNQNIYVAPEQTKTRGRTHIYGEKCRVDELRKRFPDRLRKQKMKLRVWDKQHQVEVYSAEILVRGVWRGHAQAARIIIIAVPAWGLSRGIC